MNKMGYVTLVVKPYEIFVLLRVCVDSVEYFVLAVSRHSPALQMEAHNFLLGSQTQEKKKGGMSAAERKITSNAHTHIHTARSKVI